MCRKKPFITIDTDLPDIIRTKTQLIEDLNLLKDVKGTYTLRRLMHLMKPPLTRSWERFPTGRSRSSMKDC